MEPRHLSDPSAEARAVSYTSHGLLSSSGKSAVPSKPSEFSPLVLVAGALARCTSATLLFPFDVLKVRFQFQGMALHHISSKWTRYDSVPSAFRSIVRQEGPMGLFRGLGTRLLYISPSAAVSFTVYEFFRATLAQMARGEVGTIHVLLPLFAGSAARLFGTVMRTPFDIISQRQMIHGGLGSETTKNRKGINAIDVARSIFSKSGARGFFRGIVPTLARDVPFAGTYFLTYEVVKLKLLHMTRAELPDDVKAAVGDGKVEVHSLLRGKRTLDRPELKAANLPVYLAAGAIAGTFSSCLTIPFDVVKVRAQTAHTVDFQGQGATQQFPGVWRTLSSIWRTEGLAGVTAGLGPRLLHIIPASSLTFTAYEVYKRVLIPTH